MTHFCLLCKINLSFISDVFSTGLFMLVFTVIDAWQDDASLVLVYINISTCSAVTNKNTTTTFCYLKS